jgi:hypothetical protein
MKLYYLRSRRKTFIENSKRGRLVTKANGGSRLFYGNRREVRIKWWSEKNNKNICTKEIRMDCLYFNIYICQLTRTKCGIRTESDNRKALMKKWILKSGQIYRKLYFNYVDRMYTILPLYIGFHIINEQEKCVLFMSLSTYFTLKVRVKIALRAWFWRRVYRRGIDVWEYHKGSILIIFFLLCGSNMLSRKIVQK